MIACNTVVGGAYVIGSVIENDDGFTAAFDAVFRISVNRETSFAAESQG